MICNNYNIIITHIYIYGDHFFLVLNFTFKMKSLKKILNYFLSLSSPFPIEVPQTPSYFLPPPPTQFAYLQRQGPWRRYRYSPLHDRRLIAGKRERVKDRTMTKKALQVSARNAVNLRSLGGVGLQCDCQQSQRSQLGTRVSKRKRSRTRIINALRHT